MAVRSVRASPGALSLIQPSLRRRLWDDRYLYLLVLPGLLYYLLFRYLPMIGVVIAFQDYNPFLGFLGSSWVGFEHFERIFSDPEVWSVLGNTFILSFLQIAFAFPAPILLSLMLNELRSQAYKRFVQSIVYLPHFFSWVVVISIAYTFLRQDGFINHALTSYGFQSIDFIMDPAFFRPLVVLEVIWKETGWGTILFLAALAGVNPELYEAAALDGANRWQLIWHITLPQIRS